MILTRLGRRPILIKHLLSCVIFLMSLVVYLGQDYSNRKTSFVEGVILETVGPAQSLIVWGKTSISDFFDHYILIVNASRQNDELKEKISILEKQVITLSEVRRENLRLKQLLKFEVAKDFDKVLAQIIWVDNSSGYQVIRVNKGSSVGIARKSTVITANGLVGHVYRLTENYADILTIRDINNRIDGIVSRTRSHGIVEGQMNGKLQMKYVTRTEQVGLGDQILSSGLGNIYPKGLLIGTVSSIEREDYGITQEILITPSVDFSRLEEVIILVKKEK